MNPKTRSFLRKSQFPLIIALGTMPVMVLLFAYTAPEMLRWFWAFPAAYVVLTLPALGMKGSLRFPYGIGAAALGLLLCFLRFSGGTRLTVLAAAVLYGVLLIWSLRIAGWSREREITAFWAVLGILLHLLAQLLKNDPELKNPEGYAAACRWLLGAFLLFALLVMLSMNRGSIWASGGDRQQASTLMRRKNILLTLGFFALALLVSLIPAVASGVKTLGLWVVMLLGKLSQLLSSGSSETGSLSGVEESEDPSLMVGGDAQTSRIMEILQYIAMALCAVVLVVLAFLALWWIGKKLISLIRRLWASLGRYAASVAEDYEDEITDTRTSDTPGRTAGKAGKRRVRPGNRQSMTPAERIRWRYRQLAAAHPEWRASATARENLPPELSPIYERARYSDHPVTMEEAERFEGQSLR